MSKMQMIKTAVRSYVLNNRKSGLLLLVGLGLVVLTITLDNYKNPAKSSVTLVNPKDAVFKSNLMNFFALQLTSYLVGFCFSICKDVFDGDVLARAFTDVFQKFINFRWADWRNKIDMEIYYVVFRKSSGTTKFLKSLGFGASEGIYGIILGINIIRKKISLEVSKYIIIGFVVFSIILAALLVLKNHYAKISNVGFDKLESKARDMFINYELISTYGTLDSDLKEFYEECELFLFALRFSWLTGCLISAVESAFSSLIKSFVFTESSALNPNNIAAVSSDVGTAADTVNNLNKFVNSVKDTVDSFSLFFDTKLDNFELEDDTEKLMKTNFENKISVKNMNYSYNEKLALNSINLSIKQGDKIAITGANGSGKSTFVRVLQGLYRPNGTIMVDNTDMMNLSKKSLSKIFAYIPQSPMLFNGTILDNLRCFDSSISEDVIVGKCIEFGLHEDFKALGYDYEILEGMCNINALLGQKIAFMRAIIKDAPILIVDELTSVMADALESLFIEKILKHLKGKTVIMIIHNMKRLSLFNRVFFFSGGSCVDSEGFDDLYYSCAEFRKYYEEAQIKGNLETIPQASLLSASIQPAMK